MKIMLDTNVLISALIFGGKAGKLLNMLFESEHKLYVSDYVDREFKEKLQMKWADKAEKVYSLYHQLDICFCESTTEVLGELRDRKDIPVLSDAVYHNVDLILSGDKDFLEAGLEHPIVYSPTMMLEFLEAREL
ncbi:MAG: putative toxin-antitoxin system toxin component, PIN family [Lachnospiraceae bacterium]|nr:putative toxin-antitoxin system toxin component, PIN family [Lachnospiraceae bacterium]